MSAPPDSVPFPPSASPEVANVLGEPMPIDAFPGGVPAELADVTSLPLLSAILMLAASGAALGLVIYFIIMLSDLTDDLINPYTLCDRVNSKLHFEFAAHVATVVAVLLSLHPLLLLVSLPGLALRALWWQQKKLIIDATTCYNPTTQSHLRTRWGLMCAWHSIACLFAFVQVLLHAVHGLHRAMPHHLNKVAEMHRNGVPVHGMHGMAMAGLHHF